MIIAVAIWIDGKVESLPKPNRHHDIILKFPPWEHEHGEQGFIDDNHEFVTRKVALAIVNRKDQKLKSGKFLNKYFGLFSEDLW